MRTELPIPPHIGFFEGFGLRRARRLAAARDAIGIAGLIVTAILAILVAWPS
ncbi:MAG: hypothetical protein ACK4U0_17345 [Mesorhizobium sp.]